MKKKLAAGWIAVGLSTFISCLWAFWGIIENFHEGWYFEALLQNLTLMCKYLTLMAIFMVLALAALRWPRIGGILYILFGCLFSYWIFSTRQILSAAVILGWLPVTLPIVFIGILYWYGRPAPLRHAYQINIALPLLVVLKSGIEPVIRIAGRLDDGNREARLIEGNAVKLIWAPEGPGWNNPHPNDPTWLKKWSGPTWEEAQRMCQHLTEDGKSLATKPQNIWRLPTVEEAVRSMSRHGKNCNGVWDFTISHASYSTKPDKESPLWHPHSPIIYWWTATEKDEERAYVIVYNGKIIPRLKNQRMVSQGFRAVKESIKIYNEQRLHTNLNYETPEYRYAA